jgi:hypothetical protein
MVVTALRGTSPGRLNLAEDKVFGPTTTAAVKPVK